MKARAPSWVYWPALLGVGFQLLVKILKPSEENHDAALLKAYIGYLLGPGQQLSGGLGYAPLPTGLDQKAVAQLSQITG